MELHLVMFREIITNFPVQLAYLHGSRALGKEDDESDIDIGILADASLSKEERHRLRMRLMRALAESARVPLEKIDLVILQDVPVLLQYNVIRNGKVIFAKNPSERIRYELGVEQQFDDERYYLAREADIILYRILAHPA